MGRPYTVPNDQIAFNAGWDAAVRAVHNGMNVSYPDNVLTKREHAYALRQAERDARKRKQQEIDRAYATRTTAA